MEVKQSESSYKFLDYTLMNYKKINVILGKNGSGKSILLRGLQDNPSSSKKIEFTYISPERGGTLGIDGNSVVLSDERYYENVKNKRNKNISDDFKKEAYTRLVELCNKLNAEIVNETVRNKDNINNTKYNNFLYPIDKINYLLDNITLDFFGQLKAKPMLSNEEEGKTTEIPLDKISSGEGQLICLAAEFLCFLDGIEILDQSTEYWLLLDEPDAHLHPDLQDKFIKFIAESIKNLNNVRIFIATHSTVILSALSDNENAKDATVAFLKPDQKQVAFYEINKYLKEILPVFGAHPLTRVFYEAAILFVEGDDEVRVFQKIIRSSQGKVKLYPIPCGGKGNMKDEDKKAKDKKYIDMAKEIITSLYDKAEIYVLNDGDGEKQEDSSSGNEVVNQNNISENIKYMKLNCYETENLLLTDEFLSNRDTNWDEVKERIKERLKELNSNIKYDETQIKQIEGVLQNRQHTKIKQSRNIILEAVGVQDKDLWECILGQFIWTYIKENKDKTDILIKESGSMASFLGVDLINLLKKDIK
jgi:predicted ATP-dependent endonuclease of OLD family